MFVFGKTAKVKTSAKSGNRRPWGVSLVGAAANAIWPPQCPSCGERVDSQGPLCISCWSQVHFLVEPQCCCCGVPFEYAQPVGAECLRCLTRRPVYRAAKSAMRYDDFSKALILRFKYGDRQDIARILADWMTRAGDNLLRDADLIMPVPLHWSRLFARRFNQSAILGKRIAASRDLVFDPTALRRVRRTPSQGAMKFKQRQRNVRGAFAVQNKAVPNVKDKGIILVDDVLTTGATAENCAKTLLEAGARHVDVLTAARVVQPGQILI